MANEVTILVRAKDEASKVFGGVSSAAASMSKAVGVAALAGAAAVTGIGVASVKMAADFEGSLAEVKTLLPGISDEGFGRLRQDVLDLSKEMGIATDQAVPALYQAISAGVPKENVATFLEVASKAAIGGVTDLETAVDGITSVTNAYGRENLSAQRAADIMFTAVKNGKTDFDQLSRSLFNVIPTASSLGVSFEDVTAQLAAMTAQGTPTSVATTQLRQAMVEASKSGTKLDLAIRDLAGKSFAELIAAGKTMPEIFNQLRTSMPEQDFKDLFGSVEAMNAALGVSGPNFATVSGFMDAAKDSAGAVDEAFATVSETANFQLGKAINQIKVIMIEFGSRVLPLVVAGIAWLAATIERAGPVVDAIGEAFERDVVPALERFAAFVQSDVVPAVQTFAAFVRDEVIPQLVTFGEDVLGAIVTTLQDDVIPKVQAFAAVFQEYVLPVIKELGGFVRETLLPAVQDLGAWMADHKEVVGAVVAGYIAWQVAMVVAAGLNFAATLIGIVTAFNAMRQAVGLATATQILFNIALTANPIGVVIAAIAALVAVGVLLYKNWDSITAAAERLWDSLTDVFGRIVSWLKDRFFDFLDSKFAWLALALGPVGVLVAVYKFRDELVGAFEWVRDRVGDVFDWLGQRLDDLKAAVQWVQDTISSLPTPGDVIGGVPGVGLLGDGIGAVGGLLGFASGGTVPGPQGAPQLAVVHGGEEVRTPAQQHASMRPPSTTTPIQIYFGDRHFADLMVTGLVEAVSLGRVSPSVLPGGAS